MAILVKRSASVKPFELIIPFTEIKGAWYPLVEVSFYTIHKDWLVLPLIFDTGAEDIVLKPDYQHVFPPGQLVSVGGIGAPDAHDAMITHTDVEFLGVKFTKCGVVIDEIPTPALIAGVAGRDIFKPLGFGFWERNRELYVTSMP